MTEEQPAGMDLPHLVTLLRGAVRRVDDPNDDTHARYLACATVRNLGFRAVVLPTTVSITSIRGAASHRGDPGPDRTCRNTNDRNPWWDIVEDHSIGAHSTSGAERDAAKYFGPSPNVDSPLERRHARAATNTKRHLLHQQAVGPNPNIGMNHYSLRVRHEEPALDLGIQRNIGSGDHRPPSMSSDDRRTHHDSSPSTRESRIQSDRPQKLSSGVPLERSHSFSAPIGLYERG